MAAWPYNTAAWARLRRLKLDEQPDCEPCRDAGVLTLANTVDHAVPINAGGEPFPATTGLTSMCGPCHGAKTARGVEAGAIRSTKPRKGCDADGNPLDPTHLIVTNDSHHHAGHMGDDGTGETHFSVEIVAVAFSGQSRVGRQRLVNRALADLLATRIHALAIRARAPGDGD